MICKYIAQGAIRVGDFKLMFAPKFNKDGWYILHFLSTLTNYPARARSAQARRACTLRALGLLLADGTPTGGRGEDFLNRQPDFFTETAVTPERKVEKLFSRWEINRHTEG